MGYLDSLFFCEVNVCGIQGLKIQTMDTHHPLGLLPHSMLPAGASMIGDQLSLGGI
jgi:hypothetical protein